MSVEIFQLVPTPDIASYNVLQATTTGNGASKIGVEDADGYYSSDNIEGALKEVGLSTVKIGGGLVLGTKTTEIAYQILHNDFVVRVNSDSDIDITLPTFVIGQVLWICNVGSSVFTLVASTGDNIMGFTEIPIDVGGLIIIQCTSANTWSSIVG